MDRLRDRSGDGGGRHSRMPSRWPDGPPLGDHPPRHFSHSAGPKNADGFSGGRHHPYRAGNQDHPPGGGRSPVGFRSGPGGFGPIPDEQPMPGGPRRGGGGGFTRGGSPNASEGSTFAKLFVGAVPRTATQEDIRPIFEEHGHVLEVALIKDKRTGEQQSCCFIKYATSEDADRAIRALHNQLTLPGGAGPIQVRYADGERERLGSCAVEDKLFVGSLNRRATEKEVEEIFSPYGRVDDVYLMRDEMKQSRGCGFVKFHKREMAQAAINALSGVFTMRGCEQPLIVRFADPKRPRPGESRGGPTFGGPGFGSRSRFPGFRPISHIEEPIDGRPPPNAWNSANPESLVPSSQASPHGFSGHLHSVGGFSAINSTGFSSDSISQPIAPQISLMQKPNLSSQDVPPSLQVPQMQSNSAPAQSFLGPTPHLAQLQTAKDQQVSAPYLHMQNIQSPAHQLSQLPIHHSAGFPSFPQTLPPHQFISLTAQLPASQPTAATFQIPMNLQQGLPSVNVVDQQPWPGSMVQIPVQQSPAQLLPQQQTPVLQSTFQSQQPFPQLQQLQLLQPPTLGQQQNSQQILNTPKQQQISTTSAGHAVLLASATSPSSSLQLGVQTNAVKCSWTEHTSPEGFKYYYNNATKESKWEKPEEFALFEQQQKLQQPQQQSIVTQQPLVQSQMQTNVQVQPMQIPQLQPQILLKHPTQLQQFQHSVVDVSNPPQLQAPGPSIDAGWLQMGPMVSQDWMWKNRPAG